MKKLLKIFCLAIVGITLSCNSNDEAIVELGSQTKENNQNEQSSTSSEAQNCKRNLFQAANGWKISYTTSEGKEHIFFFKFEESGLVVSNSDFLESELYTFYELGDKEEKLVLKIQGAGHFQFLPKEEIEDSFYINSCDENELRCTGTNSNINYTFMAAQEGELESIVNKKALLVTLNQKGLLRGVVQNDESFVAHYVIDPANQKIKFTYLENRILKHIERTFIQENKSYEWETVICENHSISGLSIVDDNVILDGENVSSLLLKTNSGAVSYFDNRERQFQISKTYGTGDAKDEIFNETAWDRLYAIEVNCTMGKRPLVALVLNEAKDNIGAYIFYDVCFEDEDNIMKEANDIVYFTNVTGGTYPFGGTEADKDQTNNQLSNLLSGWFDEDGLIVVRENNGADVYLYFLSPTKDNWFKVKKTRG